MDDYDGTEAPYMGPDCTNCGAPDQYQYCSRACEEADQ